jgi:hypothetical protein
VKHHYHPFRWRGWVDFGGGALGDWCCHLFNAMYKIFDPGYPETVECLKCTDFNGESYPRSKTIRWTFAADGDRPAFAAYWYDGGAKPPRPKELEPNRKLGGDGCFLVGAKGTVWVMGGHNNSAVLIPEKKRKAFGKPELKVPKSRGHNQEFVLAAKGLIPYNAPLSHFAYGAKLTIFGLLGNVAMRAGSGKLEFDPQTLSIRNNPKANALLSRQPRGNWYG